MLSTPRLRLVTGSVPITSIPMEETPRGVAIRNSCGPSGASGAAVTLSVTWFWA